MFKKFLLPNARIFKAIPSGINKIAEIFSLEKIDHDIYHEPHPEMAKCNKYLMKQYSRLNKHAAAQNETAYEKISMTLLQQSQSYKVMAFNRKYHGWFYKTKGSSMKKVFNAVGELTRTMPTQMDYHRSWIPKGENQWGRPLGVPKMAWRVFLYMQYGIIDPWLDNNNAKAPWQHGGFRGKGTKTFIEQLIREKFLKRPFIYEFDLKGYFNNITHASIIQALSTVKMPLFMKSYIQEFLKSRPTGYKSMPPSDQLREERGNYGFDSILGRRVNSQNAWHKIKDENMSDVDLYRAMNEPSPPDRQTIKALLIEIHMNDGPSEFDWIMEGEEPTARLKGRLDNISHITVLKQIDEATPWEGVGKDWMEGLYTKGVGTPQGACYSPLLTSITSSLNLGLDNKNIIMYMDDGIIAAKTEKELNKAKEKLKTAMSNMGVEIAHNKSGMVKEAGIWLKDLKIIGLNYDHNMDWIFSKTRSGTEKPMPRVKYDLLEENFLKEHIRLTPSNKKLLEWLKHQPTHRLAVSYHMMGQCLAHIWNTMEGDPRMDILIGQLLVLKKIKNSKNSFFQDHRPAYAVFMEGPHTTPSDFVGLSGDMCQELLRYAERKRAAPKWQK